jgi:hypothetical protein
MKLFLIVIMATACAASADPADAGSHYDVSDRTNTPTPPSAYQKPPGEVPCVDWIRLPDGGYVTFPCEEHVFIPPNVPVEER